MFSTVGSIGLVSLMDTNENAAIAQNIVAFRANESYDSKFLYAMLSTEENQYKAQRIVMGAVQPSIKVSQLVDVEYFVTENIAEQRKLGEYFLNLDHLITLHQCSLNFTKIIIVKYLGNSVSSLRLPSRQVKRIKITFLMKAIRLQTRRVSFHRMRNLRTVEQCEMLTKECIILSLHNPSRTILRE